MDRIYRLSYCSTCKKRDMNPKYGIVCGLTNEPASFNESCDDYDHYETEFKVAVLKHRDPINTLRNLKGSKSTTISSSWTKFSFYSTAMIFTTVVSILLAVALKKEFTIQLTVSILTFTLLGGLVIFLYSRLTIAKIEKEQLVLKKLFGEEETYEFNTIVEVSSVRLGRTKYTICKLELEDGTKKSYTIMNSKSLLSFEKIDSEKILNYLKDYEVYRRFL